MPHDRLDRLQRAIADAGFDAVALVPGANLRHLAGLHFHAGERLMFAVVPRAGTPAMVLPTMEAARVRDSAPFPFDLHPWGDGEPADAALAKLVAGLRLSNRPRVGIEPLAMRVFEARALEAALGPGAELADATPALAPLRLVKTAEEADLMRRAARIIDASLEALLPQLRPGLTEREVASRWVIEILRAGAEGPSFDCIVASGPNGAFPHHATGSRTLEPGDLVILDGGARHEGYASDITRTVLLGKATAQQAAIYEAVRDANAAGREAARPGVTGAQIDRAARAVIEAAGLGPQFLHRTGHGLGLDVHEEPYIAPDQHVPLVPGVAFTVEPGVYVPGLGGVRIEDDVLMTESGSESLTRFPRQLIELT